jgi:hypothetical protein
LIKSEKDISVLDTTIALYNYKKQTASAIYLAPEVLPRLDQAIRLRAHQHIPSPKPPEVLRPQSPLASHLNRSFWMSLGTDENQQSLLVAGAKAGYHNLLSSYSGYVKWSDLNFLDLEVIQNNGTPFKLKKASILNITSFFPIESFDAKPS